MAEECNNRTNRYDNLKIHIYTYKDDPLTRLHMTEECNNRPDRYDNLKIRIYKDDPLTRRHLAEECNNRTNRYDNPKIRRYKDDLMMETVVTGRLITRGTDRCAQGTEKPAPRCDGWPICSRNLCASVVGKQLKSDMHSSS